MFYYVDKVTPDILHYCIKSSSKVKGRNSMEVWDEYLGIH
jgi:hypothetical protein